MASPAPQPTVFTPDSYGRDSAGYIGGTRLINFLHGFYHYGEDDFQVDNKDYYQKSVLGFLIAVVALAVALLFFFQCAQCVACCITASKESRRNSCCMFRRKTGLITMIVLLLVASGLAAFSYYGRNEFQDAVDDISSSMKQLAKRFENIEDNIDELIEQGEIFNASAHASACTPSEITDELIDGANVYLDAVSSLDGFLDGIAHKIRNAAEFIDEEVPYYIDLGVVSVVTAVWVVCLLGIISMFTTCCSCDNCFVVFLATVVILALAVLIGLEVTLSVTFADFCYKGPDESILLAAEDAGLGDEPLELVTYYLTCDGTNPLDSNINETITEIDYLNDTVKEVLDSGSASCNNAALNTIVQTTTPAMETILEIVSQVGCRLINPLYTQIFYGVICDEFIRGLFILWMVQACSGFILYVSFCIYPYAAHPVPPDDMGEHDMDAFYEPTKESPDGVELADGKPSYSDV